MISKAISIRQPWAWLITMGYKPVENRTWETLWRGPVAIHASQMMTRDDYDACVLFLLSHPALRHIVDALPTPQDLQRGGIVGKAHLVACSRAHESPFFTGPFGHVLQGAEPAPFQPCKGALGYFKLPQGTLL
ncbi:ASCH domain-containing protein [Acidovorax sp.]|uniref:ASCH domain-containing protein n=1 Tax=Acidovorax sp. TaxID=1872122 RepID=UPI0025BABEB2|nr:ASCH domain-containing protein [Acidovorax sp.]MCI5070136.1 ASCH domain-containing protein [Acidovorax sp.]